MKRILYLHLLILLISCDKSDESILQDQVLHTDVYPDSLVTVIDSLKYNGIYPGESCISYVFASQDNYYDLDLNMDGIHDYRISHKYGKSFNLTWSPHNPCDTVFGFEILIESLNGRNTILTDTTRYIWYPTYAAMELDTASIVNLDLPSDTAAYLFFAMPFLNGFIPDNPEMMVGLILHGESGMNYGWLALSARNSGCTIKEFAVNLTAGFEITAGQRENSN